MLFLSIFVSLAAAAAAIASDGLPDIPNIVEYGQEVCYSIDNEADSLFNVTDTDRVQPCDATVTIIAQCSHGSNYKSCLFGGEDCDFAFSNITQRACLCGSQYFDYVKGCKACYSAHGLESVNDASAWDTSKFSSSYCAVKSTPTLNAEDSVNNYPGIDGKAFNVTSYESVLATVTWTDPLANKTAPSLYFTPIVTGTNINVTLTTATPTSGEAEGTNLRSISTSTSGGQLVPTLASNNKATESPSAANGQAMRHIRVQNIVALVAAVVISEI